MAPVHTPIRASRHAGYLAIEVLIATAVAVTGLLAHVSATLSERQLAESSAQHSEAVLVLNQIAARLRGDDDWAGLYGKLRARQDQAPTHAPTDLPLPDGRRAWPPQAYYPDFAPTENLEHVGLLIEVPPRAKPTDKPLGVKALREDWVMPEFGLPYDLDADGVIDGTSVEDDYTLLPVRIRLRFASRIGGVQELKMSVWLRGDR